MRLAVLIIVALIVSCKTGQQVLTSSGSEALTYIPTMTNRQLTDSLIKVMNDLKEIKSYLVYPGSSVFKRQGDSLVFNSLVKMDSLVVKSGWLYVGLPADTSHHHGGGVDTMVVNNN